MYQSFRPGKFWYDTEGNLIQAHAGSILYSKGKFYWYGENKEGVTGRATGEKCMIWHQGVRLYSSDDLYNWKNEGVIAIDCENKEHPFYPGRIMDRPHILYNESTKKYIMWAKIGGLLEKSEGFKDSYFAVCESEDIRGPFCVVAELRDYPAGDFDLIQLEDKAYIIFEKPHTEILCVELNDTYTGFCGKASSHIPKPFPPFTREAPAYFQRDGKKFLLTSGTTGYYPNQSIVYQIPEMHGEWEEIGDACVEDLNANSFHAQFSSVFQHPIHKELYIALGDRWLNDLPIDMPNADDMFESFFNPEAKNKGTQYYPRSYTDENTSMATYVWLPIRFREDGIPYITWEDEWRVEDFV